MRRLLRNFSYTQQIEPAIYPDGRFVTNFIEIDKSWIILKILLGKITIIVYEIRLDDNLRAPPSEAR